jgi:hypothetical protein
MGFSSLDFSLLIAYLLPGFVGVFGLTYISDWVRQVFNALLNKDASIGAAFIISIAALAVGAIISAIRDLVLDRIQYLAGAEKPPHCISALRDANVLSAFKEAVNNTYRFAQFYGNMALALGAMLIFKFTVARDPVHGAVTLLSCGIATVVLLLICHRRALKDCNRKLKQILEQDNILEAHT